jgi:hypothetical protein
MTKTRDEIVEMMLKAYYDALFNPDMSPMEVVYDALIAAGVIPQWRGIEEAPKDGTVILLNNEGDVSTGSYGWDDEDGTILWMDNGPCFTASEWMPLPTPPQNNRGDK